MSSPSTNTATSTTNPGNFLLVVHFIYSSFIHLSALEDWSEDEVVAWLHKEKYTQAETMYKNIRGRDMAKLTEAQITAALGPVHGPILFNALQPLKQGMIHLSSFVSHHITSHHITSHHITSHHITSHHITSHHITSPQHHIFLQSFVSHIFISQRLHTPLFAFPPSFCRSHICTHNRFTTCISLRNSPPHILTTLFISLCSFEVHINLHLHLFHSLISCFS
jgi:hypothetical protein